MSLGLKMTCTTLIQFGIRHEYDPRGHMWGYALSADEAKLPPSRGAVVKSHKNHVYLGFVTSTTARTNRGSSQRFFGPFIEQSISKSDLCLRKCHEGRGNPPVPNVMMDFSKVPYGKLAEHLKKRDPGGSA